ncbi:MAG TPA: response regulator, partial [Polyangiaceae bacterium]|nr:response regulator [Polyangiaceae bacterium]
PEVSRVHARISSTPSGQFEIHDLDSKNGVFVNGARVTHCQLDFGDKVGIGQKALFEFTGFNAVEDYIVQRQRYEAIGRLGVGIAHDLNNVLAALDAGAAFLRDLPTERRLGDKDVRECIADLSLAAVRASELTRGILSFARGSSAQRGAVDLSALVHEVVRMLRHTLDHSVRVEANTDAQSWVYGSHSELHQILLNLCLNARDAMPQGGTLRLFAARLKQAPQSAGELAGKVVAALSVADSGVGMDDELQRRIFEPFFTTKERGAGYGVGLATVREIVSRHGGVITVESTPGQGSRFTVYLPSHELDDARRTRHSVPSLMPSRPLDLVKILLVDDEQIVRRSVARLLRQAGFQVVEAESGADALAMYQRSPFDLVLLDVDMPDMDGEQTQMRLVALDPYVRIVFASGHHEPLREAAVRARGALGFLQKPFALESLVEIVNSVLLVEVPDELDEPTRPR